MIDGIYNVKFSSSQQAFGEGLVSVKNGSVNGGDGGYLYLGNVRSEGTGLSGKLKIKRWHPSATSIFGSIDEYELQLTGVQNNLDRSFHVGGNVVGNQSLKIDIAGKFLSPCA